MPWRRLGNLSTRDNLSTTGDTVDTEVQTCFHRNVPLRLPCPQSWRCQASTSLTVRSRSPGPERLGEPPASTLFEKFFRVGPRDVAGHEDAPLGERGRRGRQRPIE